MNCSSDDVKDLFFGDLAADKRADVDQHVGTCADCRDELASLNITRSALLSVPDAEPPRRIAFVSDKVFEPTWWQRFWQSVPQLGFASAAMIAFALLAHGFLARPEGRSTVSSAAVDPAVIEKAVQAEVAKRLEAAVAQVVASSEEKQNAKLLEIVDSRIRLSERRTESGLLLIRDYLRREQKVNALTRRASYYGGVQ